MHILLIHQAFVSPDQAGGTRHYEFAQHLHRQGHDVTIVTSNVSYVTGTPVDGVTRLISEHYFHGVRVLRAYTVPVLHRSFFWRVIAFISFMVTSIVAGLRAGPVDLVMGTTPPIFQAISAWIVALVRQKPLLFEIRDLWPVFAIDIGVLRNPLLIVFSYWLERFLYNRADHVLVNSPAYRDYLIDRRVSPEKISLIPNGVDPTMFDPAARETHIRQQWELDDKCIVTYAGALGMANDIPTILRAAAHLRDEEHIHFVLVGDGKERKNLERLAQQLNLTNVTFAGSCPKSDIPAILAASDVCVATLKDIPMFRTTYPNKVFDYMAAGRPTVLGIDGVIRKVIEAAGGGVFVPPGNDTAMAEAVRTLCGNVAKREAMGRAARDYVTDHFDRASHAHGFCDLVTWLGSPSGEH